MRHTVILILIVIALYALPALSSVYYNNEFFERIKPSDVVQQWNGVVDAYSFLKSSFSCVSIHSGRSPHRHLLYRNVKTKVSTDWLNTETIQRPPTLLILPKSRTKKHTIIDIKYTDFSGIQDVPNSYPRADCYIVPPYKNVMYVSIYSPTNLVDVYAIRETESNKNDINNCTDLDFEMLNKCQVVGPPVTYDNPVQPYFLTASRKPNKNDVSLFTILSFERLERLINLAKAWDGPMSVSVSVKDPKKELPIIMNSWLNNDCMRKNVDIHILYDDQYPIVIDVMKLFPINYLRDVALKNTRTRLVMFIESDYFIPANFRKNVVEKIPLFLNNTKTLYVIPSLDGVSWANTSMMPQTKSELATILAKPEAERTVRIRDDISYRPLEITRWLKEDDIYDIKLLPNAHFEPYYVAHRDLQYYDEIFNSYGLNKLSHMYDLRNLDYKMKMLPDVFAIHIDHKSLNQTDWSKGFGIHERYTIKAGAFVTRHTELPGLLTNVYKPLLLENLTYSIKNAFCASRVCGDNGKVELAKNVRLLKFALYECALFLVLCFLALVTVGLWKTNTSRVHYRRR